MKSWLHPIIAALLSIVALGLLISVPLSSVTQGPSRRSPLYFARIDASGTHVDHKESDDENDENDENDDKRAVPIKRSTVGLPDRFDDNKIKQHYYIYLLNYCSGTTSADGKISLDFCSKPGEEIWDLFAEWTEFDHNTDNDAKHQKLRFQWLTERPQWLRFGYATAAILTCASVGVGVVGSCLFRNGKLKWIMFYASLLSSIFLFAIVTAAQVTFGLLVFHAEEQNSVKTKKGIAVYVVNWFSLAFSIAASVAWFISCWKSSKKSPATKKGAKDIETAYKYEGLKGDHDSTHKSKGKGHFKTESMVALNAHRAGAGSRFEPLRHAH